MTDSNYRNRDYGGRSSQEDDPLMELSRIIGFDEPVKNAASREGTDDFSFDLEQELVGAVEADLHAQPQANYSESQDHYQPAARQSYQPAAQHGWTVPRQLAGRDEEKLDFSASLENELNLSLDDDIEQPGDFSLDAPFETAQHDEEDSTIYQPAYEAEDEVAPNLEDELELMLGSQQGSAAEPVQAYAPQAQAYAQQAYAQAPHYTAGHGAAQAQPVSEPRYPFPPSRSYAAPAPQPAEPRYEPAALHQEPAASQGWDEPQLDEDFFAEDNAAYVAETAPAAQAAAAYPNHSSYRYTAPEAAPQVETVSVAEARVEQTDALDLPEVEYEPEPAANAGLTALESEFAEVFTSLDVEEQTPQQPEAKTDRAFEDIFNDVYGAYGAANAAEGNAQAAYAADDYAPQASGTPGDYYNHWANSGQQDFSFDQQSSDGLGIPAAANENQSGWGRRGLVFASVAGAALLIGGLGYYGLSSGGTGAPVVIAADSQPTKVQPENPGGAPVPNQDKAVYDRVAGTAPEAPEQKSLISSEENPVDIALAEDEDGGAEDRAVNDRVQPSALETTVANNSTPQPALVPRRVQTMIVKPDGTIVQQEAAPAAPAASEVAAPRARPAGTEVAALTPTAAPANAADNAPVQTGAIPPREVQTRQTPPPPANAAQAPAAPARVVKTQAITPESAAAKPKNVPVVPSRPAEQPTRIVGDATQASGQARPTQVASAAGAAATAAASAGGYAIQIASTPSAEDAKKSYANLSRRYGNVIGGRGVDIRRADVPGKGTFYRVRINAGSKSEAIDLCTRYKAAGGSCFVTQ
ncbi:SPOR domain-containing protein [Brucella sp. IR073]|uniref:SPOR domain-containing protein n=1 Tax=unclassified Brucella TaxID=2632610 RepID=UPI003B985C5C